jgi:putative transposase
MLRDRFGVSQRRACAVVGQHRSTQRLDPLAPAGDEAELRAWLRAFSTERPRWGWRRAHKQLRREGRQINAKRVQRLWREEALKVPYKKRVGGVGTAVGRMFPIRPDALWAMDFQFDATADGCSLKLLNLVDEFTREALAIDVERSIDADHVVAVLDRLTITRGRPAAFVRFDNGPEFIAHAVADWCRFNGVGTCFIDPGSPWQNAWIEWFNSRLRDELLILSIFDSLLEAKVLLEDWRIDHNTNRPHSAFGLLTPTEFANQWATTNQPQLAQQLDHSRGTPDPHHHMGVRSVPDSRQGPGESALTRMR